VIETWTVTRLAREPVDTVVTVDTVGDAR